MRHMWLAAAGVAWVIPSFAQSPSVRATQLPPLQQQWQREGLPPDPQGAGSPAIQDQTTNPNAVPMTQSVAPERHDVWVPAGTAKLQALDKVNAQTTTLTIKVGHSEAFGSLTIAVKSCMVRPPGQSPDAAAFVDVTDSHAGLPGFDGWMLLAEPSLSMMQHPIYDLRVTGCA